MQTANAAATSNGFIVPEPPKVALSGYPRRALTRPCWESVTLPQPAHLARGLGRSPAPSPPTKQAEATSRLLDFYTGNQLFNFCQQSLPAYLGYVLSNQNRGSHKIVGVGKPGGLQIL